MVFNLSRNKTIYDHNMSELKLDQHYTCHPLHVSTTKLNFRIFSHVPSN